MTVYTTEICEIATPPPKYECTVDPASPPDFNAELVELETQLGRTPPHTHDSATLIFLGGRVQLGYRHADGH